MEAQDHIVMGLMGRKKMMKLREKATQLTLGRGCMTLLLKSPDFEAK
jgi:hypothetical protein